MHNRIAGKAGREQDLEIGIAPEGVLPKRRPLMLVQFDCRSARLAASSVSPPTESNRRRASNHSAGDLIGFKLVSLQNASQASASRYCLPSTTYKASSPEHCSQPAQYASSLSADTSSTPAWPYAEGRFRCRASVAHQPQFARASKSIIREIAENRSRHRKAKLAYLRIKSSDTPMAKRSYRPSPSRRKRWLQKAS